MRTLSLLLALLIGALAGAGAEYLRHKRAARPAFDAGASRGVTVVSPRQPDFAAQGSASVAAENLRQRVAELEATLERRHQQIAALKVELAASEAAYAMSITSAPPASVAASAVENESQPYARRSAESYAQRLERMRTEDPEAYAAMQARREEMRQRFEQRSQERSDFLASIDTRGMDAAQRENHEKLLAAIAQADEAMSRYAPEEWRQMTPEQRQAMGETMRTLGSLYEQERRYLLEETGRALGEQGADFADYIQNIFDHTSMAPGAGFMRRYGRDHDRQGPPPPPPPETALP
ncbi:MAG: hypothetical protein PHR35_03975 [Kiritimatiellae bacterium]|nr:hypothetical protein [Kiritimatiellia bacterium]